VFAGIPITRAGRRIGEVFRSGDWVRVDPARKLIEAIVDMKAILGRGSCHLLSGCASYSGRGLAARSIERGRSRSR